jgi:hypothetical protein
MKNGGAMRKKMDSRAPASKTINKRIVHAFVDADRESLEKYIEWLRITMGEYQQSLRRTVAILILLMAIFELIVAGPATTVTIASLQISKSSIALLFLPALVSYLYLQAVVESNRIGNGYDEAYAKPR